MESAAFSSALQQAANDFGLTLTEQQLAQFVRYYELLIEWNEKMNLTALTTPQEVAVKHMIDSLTAYRPELFPAGARVIDVGTGAGFPGLPLKIFCPQIELTLMDSLQKRLRFLEAVVQELGLTGVQCVHARAEEGARNKKYREQFDVAVSRAVARLPILCEYCLPFVRRGGYLLALKGAQYADEAAEAAQAIKALGGDEPQLRPVQLPGLADSRAIIEIHKTRPTPRTYPRKAGTPSKQPIL